MLFKKFWYKKVIHMIDNQIAVYEDIRTLSWNRLNKHSDDPNEIYKRALENEYHIDSAYITAMKVFKLRLLEEIGS